LESDPNWPAVLARYEADAEDVIGLPPVEMDLARYRHPGEYFTGPAAGAQLLYFGMTRSPFDDPRVRRAFVQAFDREAHASVILRGYYSPALGGLVPPGVPGHSPDIGLAYDPNQARQLLAEAGYPGGRGFPPIEFAYATAQGDYVRDFYSQWRDTLSVEITMKPMTWPALVAQVRDAPPPIYMMGWVMDYPDPDNILRMCLQTHKTLKLDEAFLKLVDEAGQSTRQEQRMAMYREADRLLVSQAVVMPTVYVRNHLLLKPWVRRYPASPIRFDFWKDVILEPH
jgi:oligopeptide transport system substrate-binding protein